MGDDDGTWRGLMDTARLVGHHLWVERELFTWLGAWSRQDVHPAVAVHLGEMSARHGWHAELLFARLPELREVDPESLVTPGSGESERFVGSVCSEPHGETRSEHLVEALAGYQRVLLPRLVASYRSLRHDASPVADASLVRSLGFVLDDDLDEWVRADALLRGLLADEGALRRAADRQLESERLSLGCPHFPG